MLRAREGSIRCRYNTVVEYSRSSVRFTRETVVVIYYWTRVMEPNGIEEKGIGLKHTDRERKTRLEQRVEIVYGNKWDRGETGSNEKSRSCDWYA